MSKVMVGYLLAAIVAVTGCAKSGGSTGPSLPPAPYASFSFSPGAPVTGQDVVFTDLSTGAPTAWAWAFGDGGSSTAQNPSHAFSAAGTYTVQLTATNAGGSSSRSLVVTVRAASNPPTVRVVPVREGPMARRRQSGLR